MYVVDSSARKATITLTGEEVAVKFPCTYSVFGIKGDSMLLYPKSGMAQGDDGVYDTAEGDGSVIMCLHYQADIVYIKGTGSCVIWAGNSTLDNPFSSTGKGGGGSGGDNTHYKGTTTTAISNGSTTNPITIDGESYTAVFGDIVVYDYTEFVFDGTTWSEFGRPFDTTPTSGSANAVTSDGIATVVKKGTKSNSVVLGNNSTASGSSSVSAGDHAVASGNNSVAFNVVATASGAQSFAANYHSTASGMNSTAFGNYTSANQANMTAIGKFNSPRTGDLFNIGNGTDEQHRSNIFEVSDTSVNVNGDIKVNNVPLPTPYTTMPTITSDMLGQIAMYVGTTGGGFTQGYFYIASSDGAAEPTYSWVHLPTQNGYSETVLWTGDQSSAPSEIEISEAYTNFDALFFKTRTTTATSEDYVSAYILTSAYGIGEFFQIFGYADSWYRYVWYKFTDATHLARGINSDLYMRKIVGIKYGSNGGAVANPVRSLAKSEEKEKPIEEEEPTDEMR